MPTTFPHPVYFTTTLKTAHVAADGQLVLQTGDGARIGSLGANQVYAITAVTSPGPSETVVCNFLATGISTDTLTGVTADVNSTDTNVASGTPLQVRITAAWVSSVQTAVNVLETGVYNVLNYGADPTGSTDASTAIQAAVNACQTAGGGIVYLPAGEYKIGTTISITEPYVRVIGNGIRSTKILLTGNIYAFTAIPATTPTNGDGLGLPGMAFESMWIDASVTQTSGGGIFTRFSSCCVCRHLQIGSERGPAGGSATLAIYQGIYHDLQGICEIEDCFIYASYNAVALTGSGFLSGMAIPLGPSGEPNFGYNGLIRGCSFYNDLTSGSVGIHLGGGTGGAHIWATDVGSWDTALLVDTALRSESNRELFLGPALFLDSAYTQGLLVNTSSLQLLHWVDVWACGEGSNNGSPTAGYPNGVGINIAYPNPSLKTVLVGGRIYANSGGGIQCSTGRLTVSGVQIHDNGTGTNGGNAIDVLGGSYMDGVVITGCSLKNNGQSGRGTGINVAANTTCGMTIVGNDIESNAQGQITIASGCDNYVIAGNTLAGSNLLTNTPGTATTRQVSANVGIAAGGASAGGSAGDLQFNDGSGGFDGGGPNWDTSTSTFTVPSAALVIAAPLSTTASINTHFYVQTSDNKVLYRTQSTGSAVQNRFYNPANANQRCDMGVGSGVAAITSYDDGAGNGLDVQIFGTSIELKAQATGYNPSTNTIFQVNGTGVGFNGATPVGKASDPGTASGSDAAVINAIKTILQNLGLCS